MPKNETCETCRFGLNTGYQYVCRRYPPPERKVLAYDWCGEYQAKEKNDGPR